MMNLITQTFVLFLWMHTLSSVKSQDCTIEQFRSSRLHDDHFDTANLQEAYPSGGQVRVGCTVGYTGYFKLICSQGKWEFKGSKCQPKRCGHPGEAQFADFRLDIGTDFVFGSRVVYTCQKGYQMQNRIKYRNCLDEGWDGIVPVCEAHQCPPIDVDDNILVNGDPFEATYGNVVRFSCKSHSEILSGSAEIYCDENGMWSATAPKCKEIKCIVPTIENGFVPGPAQEHKEHAVLHFVCDSKYKRPEERPSICTKVGDRAEWRPTPACELTKCRVNLPPIEGTRYEPAFRNVFLPDETLRVMCEDKYWISNPRETSAETTCNDKGEWTIRPICKEITCTNQRERHVYNWYINRAQRITLGDTVTYSCSSGYTSTDGTNLAKCTRDGWMPKPLCQEKPCNRQDYPYADIDGAFKSIYIAGDMVVYICKDYYEGTFTLTCREGRWIQNSQCASRQCKKLEIEDAQFFYARKESYSQNEQVQYTCGSNREIDYTATCDRGVWTGIETCTDITCERQNYSYADIDGEPKSKYRVGEVVEYICKKVYEGTFTLTCGKGSWIMSSQCTEKQCKKLEIENADIPHAGKDTFNQNEKIQYTCRSNSKIVYTAICNEGVWTGVETCTETQCEKPEIENGFAVVPKNGKLYYTCDKDYKLFKKGGWGEATCNKNLQWSGLGHCIEKSKCGEIPVIPNVSMTSPHTDYGQHESIQIICKEGFLAHVQGLTCQNGEWKSDVQLKNICKPLPSNCIPPPKFENAVVVAPPKKQYLSDSEVTYQCRDKYKMEGEGKLRCNNGKWENSIQCTPPTAPILEPALEQ